MLAGTPGGNFQFALIAGMLCTAKLKLRHRAPIHNCNFCQSTYDLFRTPRRAVFRGSLYAEWNTLAVHLLANCQDHKAKAVWTA
jgi:hypothetical protein